VSLRILWRLATAMLLAGVMTACGDRTPTESTLNTEQPSGPEPQPQKAWTFLFYDDAEFTGFDPLDAFKSTVQSGENLHVIVLQDDESSDAYTYFISNSGEAELIRRNGEVNMGDGETLRDFLTFGKEYYPAERYVVAFYDHGAAWRGSCTDVSSGNDMLTLRETRQAIARAGGVDLVLFTAPCNMGSFEAAYEFRDVTQVYIGSPNTSGYIWWIEPMGDLSATLNSDPAITNEALAESIIESIWDHRESVDPDLWQENLTMTAVRTDGLEKVAQALDALSFDYLYRWAQLASYVSEISAEVTSYSSSLVDMGDVINRLLAVEDDGRARYLLGILRDALADVIIAECHGTAWPGGTGLNLFFPDSAAADLLGYYQWDEYRLSLVADTKWDELIVRLRYYGALPLSWSGAATASEQTPFRLPRTTDGFSPLLGPACSKVSAGMPNQE
jgi:hypothetical protein